MNRLPAAAIIQIWEMAEGHHPIDQALIMLGVAYPTLAPATLAALSIGQRDTHLLALYNQTFGPQADALAHCPHCREPLTFALPLPAMQLAPPDAPIEHTYQCHSDGYDLHFRLPTSFDLAALAQTAQALPADPACLSGVPLLLQRCVLRAAQAGQPVVATDLPAAVVTALAAQMVELDPQAEILLQLTCPACGHSWQALFDIVTFLWNTIRQQAKRLLSDVHTLARGYGWSEAAILALSPARRQFYLEQLQ